MYYFIKDKQCNQSKSIAQIVFIFYITQIKKVHTKLKQKTRKPKLQRPSLSISHFLFGASKPNFVKSNFYSSAGEEGTLAKLNISQGLI